MTPETMPAEADAFLRSLYAIYEDWELVQFFLEDRIAKLEYPNDDEGGQP